MWSKRTLQCLRRTRSLTSWKLLRIWRFLPDSLVQRLSMQSNNFRLPSIHLWLRWLSSSLTLLIANSWSNLWAASMVCTRTLTLKSNMKDRGQSLPCVTTRCSREETSNSSAIEISNNFLNWPTATPATCHTPATCFLLNFCALIPTLELWAILCALSSLWSTRGTRMTKLPRLPL